jgi:hypothetical protein
MSAEVKNAWEWACWNEMDADDTRNQFNKLQYQVRDRNITKDRNSF